MWILDLGLNILVILVLVIVIQRWIIAPFDVSGASMCDNFNVIDGECINESGERLIINEASYIFSDPERGDVIIFKTEDLDGFHLKELIGITHDKYFIKRVIGLPGETVEIENGEVYITPVDGERFELQEEYLNEENRDNTTAWFGRDLDTFEVPADSYFVLGDNRKHSTDSRSCFQGQFEISCVENYEETAYVKKDLIRGKAWFVWWPLSNMRLIHQPDYPSASLSLEEK